VDFETLLQAYLSWDYETVMDSFGTNPETWTPAPPPSDIPARRLHDAIGPLSEHAVWSRKTNEVMAKLGLNFVPAYLWGRAACLGDPNGAAVASAFGTYEPRILCAVYDEARRRCSRAGLLAAREDATVDSLEEILGDVDVVPAVATLRTGLEAADPCGRTLFAGLASLPWPSSPLGQLWRACELLREFRGDSHTAIWLAAGLTPVSVNLLTELWRGMPLGPYTALRRGWSEVAIAAAIDSLESSGLVAGGAITAEGRTLRDKIEADTDALDGPIIKSMGEDFDATVQSLAGWSASLAAAGAYPAGTFTVPAGEG
jgi:hypothetical protein